MKLSVFAVLNVKMIIKYLLFKESRLLLILFARILDLATKFNCRGNYCLQIHEFSSSFHFLIEFF
jgi:hypothetical protein